MPRLTKITTSTGDDGSTALGNRRRVPKDSLRMQTIGEIDELNSLIGLALASKVSPTLEKILLSTQNDLFHLGSDLAFPIDEAGDISVPRIEERHVVFLEERTRELLEVVGPVENFILPGGSVGSSWMHLARAVCRRAERSAVALDREEEIGPYVLPFLNRLSDALFTMARFENYSRSVEEPLWDSRR